jgi:hypothetical protein
MRFQAEPSGGIHGGILVRRTVGSVGREGSNLLGKIERERLSTVEGSTVYKGESGRGVINRLMSRDQEHATERPARC